MPGYNSNIYIIMFCIYDDMTRCDYIMVLKTIYGYPSIVRRRKYFMVAIHLVVCYTGIDRRNKFEFEEVCMKKKYDLMWSLSLLIIGAATVILAGSKIVVSELPDIAVRIIGIVDLTALPILAYTTVKKGKSDQE